MTDKPTPGSAAWPECQQFYDGQLRSSKTHTCDLSVGHKMWHHCPVCGAAWEKPRGQVKEAHDA